MQLDGRIWITIDNKPFLGMGRIKLLKLIDEKGSISKAAKELKMSYKAAWDMIDSMNSIAKDPLVERVTGGSGGGGTVVTATGKQMIKDYETISKKHQELFSFLSDNSDDLEKFVKKTQKIALRTSARNQFWGEVVEINQSDLTSEIKVSIDGSINIYTTITKKSKEEMELKVGSEVFLLIKASFIELNSSSHKNSFEATIKEIKTTEKTSELLLAVTDSFQLVATISDNLNLNSGDKVTVGIDPNNIIVGI